MTQTFKDYLINNTTLGERTIRNYVGTISRFKRQYTKDTVANMNKFISSSTRNKTSYYVKYAFKHYLDWKKKSDKYRKLVGIKERPPIKAGCYLPIDALIEIINKVSSSRHKIISLIQYLTGARSHDVFCVRTSDFSTEPDGALKMRLAAIKGGSHEYSVFIPLSYAVRVSQFVNKRAKTHPFLEGSSTSFTKLVDTNYNYYYQDVKTAARTLGHKNFAPHDFRRNFLEDARHKTKDFVAVQKLAGHKRLETTVRYFQKHVDEEKVKELTELLRG